MDPWKRLSEKAVAEKLVKSLKAVQRFDSVGLHFGELSHRSMKGSVEYAVLYQTDVLRCHLILRLITKFK